MYTIFALFGLAVTLAGGVVSMRKGDGEKKTGLVKFYCKIGEFIEKYYYIFFILIFAVFLFSRVFKLDSFPNGFHVDELSMAVDAKSIRDNGTDRSGIRYPVYFQNYGGGQNALYTYVEALLLTFLPETIFSFRIQAVFWGALCLFAMYGICHEITGSRGFALMGPVLVTILPVYIMSERWGLEAYLFLPFSAYTMYFAIKSVKYEKLYWYVLTGTVMGFSLYTYAVSYIVWPVFLILTGWYLIYLKKIGIKQVLALGIPLFILAFPLMLYQLVNFKLIPAFSTAFSDFFPLPIPRESELGFSNIITNIGFIKELFLGGEELTYNSFKEFGTIYMFLLPFVAAGFFISLKELYRSVKEREFTISGLILFFWAGATVFTLLVYRPNVNRVNELFMPFLLFIVIAIYELFRNRPVYLTWLSAFSAASFAFFMYFYFFCQNPVYGLHPLFTSASPGKAIIKSQENYLKDGDTRIYVQFEDIAISPYQQVYYFAADKGEVYSDEKAVYGRVSAKLPDELDINENAVYIIGDDWPHITSYLISEGFLADQTIPGYSILYR